MPEAVYDAFGRLSVAKKDDFGSGPSPEERPVMPVFDVE
jgi:hypothetical protein